MKRKHQAEMESVIDGIIAGSAVRTIIAKVTPGGGKSALPIISGKLINAGYADALCWVVPRKSLQDQGERNFVDPFFREMFDHRMLIRSSTNEDDPTRGLSGFVTTYQAIGVDGFQKALFDFFRRRYILILDEFHHVEEGGVWHKALEPLIKAAAYVVLMTGTLERGDGKKIAFMPYRKTTQGYVPDLQPGPDTAIIQYGRTDALAERAIIRLKFHLSDARAAWIDKDGFNHSVPSIAKVLQNIASQAIFTVLSSEFADQLLKMAIDHWLSWKHQQPRSKFLVVTAGIERAREAVDQLQKMGLRADIATSHESTAAHQAIKNFKAGMIDVLVTIAMAYEGLDCPPVSHICCLTNIRSTPWIEQMVARAVRIDQQGAPYEAQTAFVFAPDDVLFRNIVEDIRRQQLPFVARERKQLSLFESSSEGGGERVRIEPLESRLTDGRELDLGGVPQQPIFDPAPMMRTPKDMETELRKKIDSHVKRYAFFGRYKEAKLNREIKEKFGKSRADMTIQDLKAVWSWVKENFDLNNVRGSRRRVPTKAVRWHG